MRDSGFRQWSMYSFESFQPYLRVRTTIQLDGGFPPGYVCGLTRVLHFPCDGSLCCFLFLDERPVAVARLMAVLSIRHVFCSL